MPDVVLAQPRRWVAVLTLLAGAALGLLGAVTQLEGRLLVVPGTVLCLGVGLRDLLLVPVLRADAAGLVVRQGLRTTRLTWAQVRRLRVVADRTARLLEVEADDDRLLLLSRGRLGRDPRDVLDALQALRPR